MICSLFTACKKEKEQQKVEQFMNATIEETVIYDDDNVTASIVSLNWLDNDGLDILFRINDKNNLGLSFDIGERLNINGAMMVATRGQSSDGSLLYYTISEDDINMCGIKNIYMISMDSISIYNRTDEEYIVENVKFEIKTDMYDDAVFAKETGDRVFESSKAIVYYTKASWGTISASPVLCIKNKSTETLSLAIIKVSIDGNEPDVPTISTGFALPGTLYYINVVDYLQSDCGIDLSNAKTITLKLGVIETATGKIEYTHDNYVIQLQENVI